MARHLGKFQLPAYATEPCRGVATWVNPHNQCTVLLVHYTADEDRRSHAWLAEARRGYTEAAWDQEQELDFSSWGGMPVFLSFSSEMHVAKHSIPWSRRTDWPMVRGWDIGTHACVWAQLQRLGPAGERLKIFTARQAAGAFPASERKYEPFEIDVSGLALFIQSCLLLSDRWFPDIVSWVDIIDPSGFNRDIKKTTSPANEFQRLGLSPIPGRTQDIDVRVSAVEDWLSLIMGGEPAFQIDPQAILIIDALDGGYHWEQLGRKRLPDKGPFSHVGNTIEYLCTVYPSPKSTEIRLMEQQKRDLDERGRRRFPRSVSAEQSRYRENEDWAKIDW